MKKRTELVKMLACALVLSTSLAGCGGSPGAPAEEVSGAADASAESGEVPAGSGDIALSVAHFFMEDGRSEDFANDTFNTLKEEWMAANPDITINETRIAHDDYQTKIQAQAAVGELPDVFLLKGSWVKNFVQSDLLKPLDSYVDTYEYRDSYREGMFDSATYEGAIYGHPSHVNVTSIVFYNEQMWKDAGYDTFPATWAELEEAAAKFEADGISAMTIGNKDSWVAESCMFSSIGDSYTGTEWTNGILANDGSSKFTDANFVAALDRFQKVAQAGVFNPDFNSISNNQSQEYYCQGRAAATCDGNWAVGYVETNAAEEVLANTKLAALPAADGGEGKSNVISVGCGWYFGINSSLEGERLEAAVDFIFATTGYENSRMITEKYGQTGAMNVDNPDMSGLSPMQQQYVELLSGDINNAPVYDLCMDGAVIEVMNSGLQTLLSGSTTPEELAADIQAEQDKLTNS